MGGYHQGTRHPATFCFSLQLIWIPNLPDMSSSMLSSFVPVSQEPHIVVAYHFLLSPTRTVLLFWSVMAFTCLLLSAVAHWFSFLCLVPFFSAHEFFLSISNNFQPFLAYDFSTSHFPKNGAAWVTTRGLQPPVFTLTRCYITP